MAFAPHALIHFLENIFPAVNQRCKVCGVCLPPVAQTGRGAVSSGMCAACQSRLMPRTSGFCPRCGMLFILASEPVSACLNCRLSPPPWRQTFLFGAYEDLLKDLVLRFKFHGQLGLGLVLREMLASALLNRANPHFDLITPIPLHHKKLRSRGFNQSLELAKGLADSVSGTINAQALIRVRNTPAQHTLPRAQRIHNLKGAFTAQPSLVRGRSILLVDDILTTGATARAATKALLKAGAKDVSLLILARA